MRIPAGSDSAKRIEHRVASAAANPYLVLACILSGLHYGLTKNLSPTDQVSFDNTEGADKTAAPQNPKKNHSALTRFQPKTKKTKYLGKEYLDLYVSAKEGEFEHMDNSFIPSEEYDFYL